MLTDHEQSIVTIVYTCSLVPLALVLAAYYFKKLPKLYLKLYFIGFLLCALGWEIWFTYGLVDGLTVNERRPLALNNALPQNINWLLNSLGDAAICGVGLLLVKVTCGINALRQWSWPAFAVLAVWFISQNIYVELVVYHAQLQTGHALSWAPLVPTGPWYNPVLFEINGRTASLQGQIAWFIMAPLYYFITIEMHQREKVVK